MVAFDSVIDVAPVTAVSTEPEPQLVVVAGCELLIVTLAGRLSTIEKFVRLVSAGALMLIRKREFSPGRMVAGENDLLDNIPPPAGYTSTRAEAGIPFVTP
jgi:hypothetical protein